MAGILALMIPVLALMIPIVAILVTHQQKMAEILQRGRNDQSAQEIAALRAEMRELKEMVHQQVLAMDSIAPPRVDARETSVQERLTING